MKRLLLLFLAFPFLFTLSVYPERSRGEVEGLFHYATPVKAQTFDFNKALSDYLYNYNIYRNDYLKFTSARSEFLNYKTLTSENKAFEATKIMLSDRSMTMKTYLTTLRMKLYEETAILNYNQNFYYIKLDDEVAFLDKNKNEYASAGSIDDLLTTSKILEDRFPAEEKLTYQTLGQIDSGIETNIKNKINNIIGLIETKVGQIKAAGEDTTVEERWILQAKEKVKRAEEKDREAYTLLTKIDDGDDDKLDQWNKIQKVYEEEHLYYKEAVSFLKEIVREIKSAKS